MSLLSFLEGINVLLVKNIDFSPPRIERRNMEIPMTGIYELDRDHLEIIRLINQVEKPLTKEIFFNFAMSTLDYLTRHIKEEEKLMRQIDYPGLRIHAIEHQSIRDLVSVYIKPSGDNAKSIPDAMRECREIFRHHIQCHDIPLANYIKERNMNV